MDKVPQLDATPSACPVCDTTLTLGLLTSTCEEISDPSQKGRCFEIIRPLETGGKKAVDVLRDLIVEVGDSDFNKTVDRMNLLVYDATMQAKEILIKKGVLNKDGTPRDPAGVL